MVWVNSENNRHLPTPFGGMKAAGIGRDGGDYSFDFYMETKNVSLAHGTHKNSEIGNLMSATADVSTGTVSSLSHGERVGVRGTVYRWSLTPHPALRADLSHRER